MINIKDMWNKASLTVKIVIVVVFPAIILLFLFGKGSSIVGSLIEAISRKKVDKASHASKTKESTLKNDSARSDGRIETLEKERDEKANNSDDDDSAAWHNSR